MTHKPLSHGEVKVTPVETSRDRREFLQLPWRIYKAYPNWVPPLLVSHLGEIGFKRDAFYIRNKIRTFLAWRNNRVVGRIAAILNQGHLDRYHDATGFFGYFESEDDPEVASALFDTARDWLRPYGITRVRGPMNPSINHELGLLIEGYEHSPFFMMTYNPPYYQKLVEDYGFIKAHDLYAYAGFIEMLPNAQKRLLHLGEEIKERYHITIRSMNPRKFEEEVRSFLHVYNEAFTNVWGAVEMSEEEVAQSASGLKLLLVPELSTVAEVDGRMIGCSLCLPDYNPRIRAIKGRLFPFGFLRLLMFKSWIKDIRVISTTVLPEYQLLGVPLLLLQAMVPLAMKWGIKKAEFSWVLESNHLSRRSLEKGGVIREKAYRLYDIQDLNREETEPAG